MDKIIKDKLNEILDGLCVNNKSKLSKKSIALFEERFQISLPECYKEFLGKYYSCYIKENYYFPIIEKSKLSCSNGMEMMDYFFNDELITIATSFIDLWGRAVIPIGCAAGDYICLSVSNDDYGKIYFYYHEDEDRSDKLYLIANSFNEFVLSFKYIKPEKKSVKCVVDLYL